MAVARLRQSSVRASLLARLPLYMYMFYVIYTPPIGVESPMVKFVVLATAPLLLGALYSLNGEPSVRRMLFARPVMPLILSFLAGSLYVAVVILAFGQDVAGFDELRIVQNSVILLVVLNVLFIIDLLAKTGHDWIKSFEVVLWLGSAQGIFAIFGVFIPAVRDISRGLYIAAGGSNPWVIQDRIYGISSDFTYATQIYHAILAGCALYLMIRERRPYLIQIILVMATSLLNGRTGLLAFAAMSITIIVIVYISRFNLAGMLVSVAVLVIGGTLAFGMLEEYAPATYRQLMVFFSDTENLFTSNEYTGNYSVLVPELMRVPEGNGLIFGEGVRLYTEAQGERTDIGFTNDLFAGGLIYVFLVYIAFVVFLRRSLKGHPALLLALLMAATIANLKGEMFRSTTLLFVFVFIPLVIYYGALRGESPKGDGLDTGERSPLLIRSRDTDVPALRSKDHKP